VDVIVATVILGVALAALIGILGRCIGVQTDGEHLQTAAMLLDEQLNLVLMRGPDSYASRFDTEGPCDPPFSDFTYRLDIAFQSTGLPYSVKATVTWTSAGRARQASVSTLIASHLGDEPDPLRTPDTTVERLQ
jgi:hypothetical protein